MSNKKQISQKIKILFILPSLHPGGAERVVSFIAQNIDKNEFEPFLLVLYKATERDYKIDGISYEYLYKKRSLNAIPDIIKKINSFKPQIVFTSIGQLNLLGGLLSTVYRRTKFIAREASVLSYRKKYTKKKKFHMPFIKPFAYKSLSAMVCQSQDMAEDIQKSLDVRKEKIYIIGNPSNFLGIRKEENKKIKEPVQLISVGRLTKVKGYERLLRILGTVDFKFHFTLIGDGEDREKLMTQAQELGITEYITHIPYTNKVSEYLIKADLFLQGSYVEGFPNALLESCTVGVPVLAFNVPGGTKEIIKNGVNGFLAADESNFTEIMQKAIFDTKWRTEDIIGSVRKKFNSQTIVNKYESLFNSLIS